jgi:hypothetical protein
MGVTKPDTHASAVSRPFEKRVSVLQEEKTSNSTVTIELH